MEIIISKNNLGQSRVYYIFSSISIQSGVYPLKPLWIEDIPSHFEHQVFKKPKLWRNYVSRIFEELEEHSKDLKDIQRAWRTFEELKEQQISNKLKARDSLWRPFDPSSNQIEENFAFESRP